MCDAEPWALLALLFVAGVLLTFFPSAFRALARGALRPLWGWLAGLPLWAFRLAGIAYVAAAICGSAEQLARCRHQAARPFRAAHAVAIQRGASPTSGPGADRAGP
jgi:hypothetical protein